MIMGFFGIIGFYLKTFEVIFLSYANARLLFVGQRNSVSFNIHPSISNLTFCCKRKMSLEIII
jgi:hypothetical protein